MSACFSESCAQDALIQEMTTRYWVDTHLSRLSVLSKLNIPAKFLLETHFAMYSYKDYFHKTVFKKKKALKIDHAKKKSVRGL